MVYNKVSGVHSSAGNIQQRSPVGGLGQVRRLEEEDRRRLEEEDRRRQAEADALTPFSCPFCPLCSKCNVSGVAQFLELFFGRNWAGHVAFCLWGRFESRIRIPRCRVAIRLMSAIPNQRQQTVIFALR
jgi:hypothetical protein